MLDIRRIILADSAEVLMPLMGEGVNEATLIKWLKKPGDKVEKDEPLLEVSTDKVDTEIPSPRAGYLIATFANEGDVVDVYQTIAQISENSKAALIQPGKRTESLASAIATATPKKGNSPATTRSGSRQNLSTPAGSGHGRQSTLPATYSGFVRTSPLVRKMAAENNLDLRQVTGSGLYGRLTKNDVLDFLNHGGTRIPQFAGAPAAEAFNAKGELCTVKTIVDGKDETLDGVVVRREKMSKMRWLTAEHMLKSVRTSPHVTTTFEIDLEQIVAHRNRNKDSFFSENDVKLTFTPYLIQAAIHALKKFPEVNSSIDGDDILYKEDINIACAVAVDSGLIVPVIKRCNSFGLKEIALGLNDVASRARAKKLRPDDVKGGTFSITNPGMYGSIHSQPIINQPQVAIMSVGAIVDRPVIINKDIAVRPICQIGLTFDHRLVDGEGGAKFLAEVKSYLENYASEQI
jgi:2-oxoglutarate dehydrogenase E2 component (dihydrolipoamide succinyltransferase)